MIFNVREIITRLIKYFIEGFVVAIAAFLIPKHSQPMRLMEVALIGLTAAATFSLMDLAVPAMGASARTGAGFGIGANLVGFPGGF